LKENFTPTWDKVVNTVLSVGCCCRTFYSIWTGVGNNISKYKSFPRLIGGNRTF